MMSRKKRTFVSVTSEAKPLGEAVEVKEEMKDVTTPKGFVQHFKKNLKKSKEERKANRGAFQRTIIGLVIGTVRVAIETTAALTIMLFMGMQVIPIVAVSMAKAVDGLSSTSPFGDLYGLWILPSGFVTIVLAFFSCWVLYGLWKLTKRFGDWIVRKAMS